MKRMIGMSLFLVLALVLTACASSTPTATSAPPAAGGGNPTAAATSGAANTVNVSLKGFAFDPKEITVKVGTTIVWTNNDSVDHNVTSDTGVFSSGNMAPGDTFKFTFTQAGTFPYSCSIHVPNMVGTVTVTP